jgi:hypothetical protein
MTDYTHLPKLKLADFKHMTTDTLFGHHLAYSNAVATLQKELAAVNAERDRAMKAVERRARRVDRIPLADLPRDLAAQGVSTSYMNCWRGVIEGRIPAERHGGRWVYNPADLPKIASHFIGKAK